MLLGCGDVIFGRERSDDRKYVCGSQARVWKEKTGKIKGRCQPLLSQMLASVVDTLAVFFLWLEIYRGL